MNARPLPYGLHTINDDDVEAVRAVLEAQASQFGFLDPEDIESVLGVLQGELLAQGPQVEHFEAGFAKCVAARAAAACSSGTAALHLALTAAGIEQGDTCIVPAITFVATATAVRFCGAEVVFADVDPRTGLLTADTLKEAIRRARRPIKAVLPVHLGGRMCDVEAISQIAGQSGALVVEDGCHALGTVHPSWGPVGASLHSTATVFSFHPVKTIACGEGGMVTTNDLEIAERIKRLRNHGVTRDPGRMVDPELSFDKDGRPNPWSYEQLELGFNYRMTEIEAALGACQLKKLGQFVDKRRELARTYNSLLQPLEAWLSPVSPDVLDNTSLHIYSVRIKSERLWKQKALLMRRLLVRGIGTQVHYIPVYSQPYFSQRYGPMSLPGAEEYYSRTLTLPLFPKMTNDDVRRVVLDLTAEIAAL